VNLTSTVEHFVQMALAAGCAYWLRDSLTDSWYTYQVQFFMLMWLVVSWGLFIPLLVPPNNTVLTVGFFMAFFGLLFSGAVDPVTYRDIYTEGNDGIAIFSGVTSVTRFFIEGLAVQELRSLPEQSGYTVQPSSVNFPIGDVGSFTLVGLAQNDLSVVQHSGNGWYWGVLPAFMVGLTVRVLALGTLHVSDRPRQNKKPLMYELKREPLLRNRTFYYLVACVVSVLSLFSISVWLIITERGSSGLEPAPQTREGALAMSNETLRTVFPGFAVDQSTLPTNLTDLLLPSADDPSGN
jgi:hypothetical protein